MDPGSQNLSDFIFTAKYANHLEHAERRETWPEAHARVFNMHRQHFAGKGIDDVIDTIEASFADREILGSQRALQFGGAPILTKHARGYNCTFSYADRVRFFAEAFWLLLCGSGVGFSVQKHHVARLPNVQKPRAAEHVFVVPDTIEGWADAANVLVLSYVHGLHTVRFDYSLIRPKGARISTGAGRAPGHEPLARALEDVRGVLDTLVDFGATRLRPIDVYDIVMFLSQAVLSGGVRRSATICLFSPDDSDMLHAKTGDWWQTNPQRARSNNSAVLVRSKTTFADFDRLVQSAREFGEPGFYFVDSTEHGTNPCCEIGLYPVDELTGATGWQFCNLSLSNVSTCTDGEDFIRRAVLAAQLGTLQAGYTSFGYLGPVSERISRRESLLGVSMTGMQEARDLAFDPKLLSEAARAACAANDELAERIGIPRAARVTCVKPEGTSSCLLGTSSGIHPHHAQRYIRRVQAGATEAPALHYAAANPGAVEFTKRIGDSGRPDLILCFPIEAPAGANVQANTDAISFLEDVRTVKRAWVDEGRREDLAASRGLSHNVSNTVTVRADEWPAVARKIYDNRDVFSGVSLLSESGDLLYAQAPFVACEGEGDRRAVVEQWERLRATLQPVDYSAMWEPTDGTNFGEQSACAGGSCSIV